MLLVLAVLALAATPAFAGFAVPGPLCEAALYKGLLSGMSDSDCNTCYISLEECCPVSGSACEAKSS